MTAQQFLNAEPVRYRGWFGDGDSHTDYKGVVGDGPAPIEVIQDDYMLCLIWPHKVVVTGYDGNEYGHTFTFDRNTSETPTP